MRDIWDARKARRKCSQNPVMQKGGDLGGGKQDKHLRGSSGWWRGRQEVPWVAQEQGQERSKVTLVEVGTETLQAWDLLPEPGGHCSKTSLAGQHRPSDIMGYLMR